MVENSDSFHRVALASPRPLGYYFIQQMGRKDENDIPASWLFLPGLLWALVVLQQCENFFGIIVLQFVRHLLGSSMVGLIATSSRKTYATCHASQVCCSESPCPCGRTLLTRASAGDTQTLKGRSVSVSCEVPGSWCTQSFVCTLWASLVGMRFDSKHNFVPPSVLLWLLLCPWTQSIFLWWDPRFSCWWLFSS